MPLVTVTLHKGRTREFKAAILDAIQRSLVASGVPEPIASTAYSNSTKPIFATTPATRTSARSAARNSC